MKALFEETMFMGVFFTLISYGIGLFLNKKLKLAIFNPLFIATVISIAFVLFFDIDTKKYAESTKIISYLLTPVTVCLAIPLYEQLQKLKDNWIAIVGGIVSGVITCLFMVLAGSIAFNLDHQQFVSMLPKSITTPIGIALSEQYGGVAGITVGAIVITGIVGNVCAESVLKLFRITEPVAKGVAIGTASHALGTTKAIQMGEVEGAMSGLSIAVAGLLTVVFASFFTMLY